jgi:hypothetical protein
MLRKALVACAVAGLLVAGPIGCGSKVSKDNFDKIKDGMTIAEVESILGKGEKASAGVSVAGVSVTGDVYEWKDGEKVINVVFKDGKMVGKTQKGL